jgi:hypothetical protein
VTRPSTGLGYCSFKRDVLDSGRLEPRPSAGAGCVHIRAVVPRPVERLRHR